MSGSSDAKAESQQRDIQVVTVGLGSPYPAELIHPAHAATSTRTLFRLVPESQLNDPDGEVKRYRRDIVILLRERIWMLKLLACEPFRGLTDYEVRDVRKHVPDPQKRVKPCPMRPLLIRSLAHTLVYRESVLDPATLLASFRAYRDLILADIDSVLDSFEAWLKELRRLGMVFEGQTNSLRPLLKAKQALLNQIRNRQPVPGAQTSQRMPTATAYETARSLFIHIVQLMVEDFRAFGPDFRDLDPEEFLRNKPYHDAIYWAVAATLNGVGVRNTHGKCVQADALEKLLRRYPPPRYMFPRDDERDKYPQKAPEIF